MIEFTVCPSTLKEGFSKYSPAALRALFDGKEVSPMLNMASPSKDSHAEDDFMQNAGRISLSGVQTKFSVTADSGKLRYTNEGEQGTFILKPIPVGYHLINRQDCPANENLTMQIASQIFGIETAANAVCFYSDGSPAYIARRFDVHPKGKYQQEDFASLMGLTKFSGGRDYKYSNGSYEECGDIIKKYVRASAIDLLRFFRVVLFNFITLNDDAHLKNFSLINKEGEYRLSPAYDLINTSLHLHQPQIFALKKGLFREGMTISDTKSVGRKDFEEFGRRLGLSDRILYREIDTFINKSDAAKSIIDRSFLSSELKQFYWKSMEYRVKMLTF